MKLLINDQQGTDVEEYKDTNDDKLIPIKEKLKSKLTKINIMKSRYKQSHLCQIMTQYLTEDIIWMVVWAKIAMYKRKAEIDEQIT